MTPFLAAFAATFIAEMGDKTQLVTLTLSSRMSPKRVFLGAMAALALVTGLGVAVGGLVGDVLPAYAAALAGGIFFIVMGIFSYTRKDAGPAVRTSRKSASVQAFGLIFLAEMGDKTQLTALALTATYGAPLLVFAGAMLGQALNHGLAAFLGARYLSLLSPKFLKTATLLVFLFFGLLMIYGGLQEIM
jgi:Ca2+/H+ antiporter, TMEM165/GDT1 family